MANSGPNVGLFVTCLVDLLRPSVGFASVWLLESAGCNVTVPERQTCCGQPAYNSGHAAGAQAIARTFINEFEEFDYVVVPSASCAAMLKVHMPQLFSGDGDEHRANRLASRIFELTEFLSSKTSFQADSTSLAGRVAFHDGCSGLRDLGIFTGPRKLLGKMSSIELVDIAGHETCCGFGGTFSVRYPEISNAMAGDKCRAVTDAGPDILTGCELGCLMHIAGKLSRQGAAVHCRHISEILAGDLSEPPIGHTAAERRHEGL